jgi:hypothetical protein
MTDENSDAELPPQYAEPVAYQLPDHVLMALVTAADTIDMELSVTLHVSGVVVSGTLISEARLYEQLAEALRQVPPPPDMPEGALSGPAALATAFDSSAEEYREQAELDRSRNEPPPVIYIHLRDAAVWAPGGEPLPRMLWRGRLSHVSGWSLGALGRKGG